MIFINNVALNGIIYIDEMSVEDLMSIQHYYEEVLGLTLDTRRLFR